MGTFHFEAIALLCYVVVVLFWRSVYILFVALLLERVL